MGLYLLAASITTGRQDRTHGQDAGALLSLPTGLGLAALAFHALALVPMTLTGDGINVSVFNTASVVAWIVVVLMFVASLFFPLLSMSVVLLPLAAITLGLAMLFPSMRILPAELPVGLQLHVVLAVLAYSLFAIALLQALFFAVAERKLRAHHPIMHVLPPLMTMEAIMFQVTWLAFALLTISLVIGVPFVTDMMAQHLTHKVVFSAMAWGVFATLLWGRWRYGWRGRLAVRFVIIGSICLGIGFFGSKIVLELVLHRV